MRLAPLAFAFLLTTMSARAAEPLSLAQVMADPDWIGPSVEDAWWRWDGKAAQYALKREGASIRDTWQQPLDGSAAKVGDADRA
ncbi:MAG TPA: S9 family peptidase, partial [Lysobacter sp.]|nr:S9 family peptidase [Lysobacter sp.]